MDMLQFHAMRKICVLTVLEKIKETRLKFSEGNVEVFQKMGN